MDWLRENWFWLVMTVLFVLMHTVGHGAHGHGGHSARARDRDDVAGTPRRDDDRDRTDAEAPPPGAHRH